MHLRSFGLLVTLAGCLLVAPLTVATPPPSTIPRLGYLGPASPASGVHLVDAFRQGLREFGYVEGRTIAIEFRWAERPEHYAELAGQLVHLPVDILVALGPMAAQAAQQATTTRPVVVVGVGDAVGLGLIASLARPGGNLTGLSEQYPELVPKWLELLKEAVPEVSRVAVLVTPPLWSVQAPPWQALLRAAAAFGITLQAVDVREPDEFASAFAVFAQAQSQALLVLPHPLVFRHRTRLVDLAAQHQLPTMWGPFREFVHAGGLMAYGPSLREQSRRAAYYVDKLLKGTKPADLPVEQPTKFELILNLKTAQVLGLTIPPSLLIQADEVIQ